MYTVIAEIKPEAGGVPEIIFFRKVPSSSKEEAIKKVEDNAMDVAEDFKKFWGVKVNLTLRVE